MAEKRSTKYQHVKIGGTPYEAGRQLGRFMKDNTAFIGMMTSCFPGQEKLGKAAWEQTSAAFEKLCPGINEEIRGFAEEIGADCKDIIYYYAYMRPTVGACSLIALPGKASNDGESVLARNYEFAWDDNSILIESDIENQYAQIGFGCQLFGRFDGMNEHGLCIATAAGVINPEYKDEGFVFPVIIRAILNRCKTVEEALVLYDEMKVADYRNFMIMDAAGNAVLIEAAASAYGTRRTDSQVLYAANHYETEQLKQKNFYTPNHSIMRYRTLEQTLAKQNLSQKEIKDLLAAKMPNGLCCHYYGDGMGTMWSILFHPEKKSVEVCFGAPDQNSWRTFFVQKYGKESIGTETFQVMLESENALDGMWENSRK